MQTILKNKKTYFVRVYVSKFENTHLCFRLLLPMASTASEDEFWLPSSPNSGDCAKQELESDGIDNADSALSIASSDPGSSHSMLGLMMQEQDEELRTEDELEILEIVAAYEVCISSIPVLYTGRS
jgi:hypothetical protein